MPGKANAKSGKRKPVEAAAPAAGRMAPPAHAPMTDAERRFLAVVQDELPLVPRPFAAMAAKLGLDEAELVATLKRFIDRRWVRRFGAMLHHREAGYSHNAMVTFDVPADECDAAGERAAAFPWVTHCYRRTRHAAWPYTLYAMVHSRSEEESAARVAEVRRAVGERYPSLALHSTREFKKTSLRIDGGPALRVAGRTPPAAPPPRFPNAL